MSTLNTLLIFPFCTKTIYTRNKLIGIPNTFPFLNNVSSITRFTLPLLIPGVAQVTNGGTYFILAKVPSFRALNTFFILPLFAPFVVRMNQINRGAFTINNIPALIAFLTDSFSCVEYLALRLNFTANSVLIKIESFGTFNAYSILKFFTTKVIVDEC